MTETPDEQTVSSFTVKLPANFKPERKPPRLTLSDEQLADATYTAAEVKVLTETASKVAYALGRKDAGEEIALALEAIPATVYPEDIFLPDSDSVDAQSARVMRFAYPAAARIARDVVSEEPPDASEPRTDLSVDTDLPQDPRAVRSPQEPCEDPECPVVLMHSHPEEDAR